MRGNLFTICKSTYASKKFKKQVFFVLNPDTLWRKEYKKELKNLIKIYQKNKKPVLLLVPKSKSFDKSFKGDFNLNSRKQVLRQKNNKLIFTGAQILTRSVFKSKKIKPFSMNKVWDNLIKKKELNWEATSQNEVITVFDLKGYSSKIGIIKSLSEEFKIRSI